MLNNNCTGWIDTLTNCPSIMNVHSKQRTLASKTMERKNSTMKKDETKLTDNNYGDNALIRSDTFGVLCDINCHRWIATLLSYSLIYPKFNLPSDQLFNITSVHETKRNCRSSTLKQTMLQDRMNYQQSLSCFCLTCHLCCCCFTNGACCGIFTDKSNLDSNSPTKLTIENSIIDNKLDDKISQNFNHKPSLTDEIKAKKSIILKRKDSDLKSSLPNAVSTIIAIASSAKPDKDCNENFILNNFNSITKDNLPAMTADDLSIITLPPTRQQQQHYHQPPKQQQQQLPPDYYFSSDRSGSKTSSSSTSISVNRSWFCCLTQVWKRFLVNLLFILIAIRYVIHVSKC